MQAHTPAAEAAYQLTSQPVIRHVSRPQGRPRRKIYSARLMSIDSTVGETTNWTELAIRIIGGTLDGMEIKHAISSENIFGLMNVLVALLGRQFTMAEIDAFDHAKLIGSRCRVRVVWNSPSTANRLRILRVLPRHPTLPRLTDQWRTVLQEDLCRDEIT